MSGFKKCVNVIVILERVLSRSSSGSPIDFPRRTPFGTCFGKVGHFFIQTMAPEQDPKNNSRDFTQPLIWSFCKSPLDNIIFSVPLPLITSNSPTLKPQDPTADFLQNLFRMGSDHQDGCLVNQRFESVFGLLHKIGIAHAQPLVHQQNVRFDARGDRKRQSHDHAGGVGPDRHINIFSQTGEIHDLFHFLLDIVSGKPQQQSLEKNIFQTGRLDIHPDRDIQKGRHAPMYLQTTSGGLVDPGQDPEKRRLSGPVMPRESDPFPFLNLQVDPVQGPNGHTSSGITRNPSSRRHPKKILLERAMRPIENGIVDTDVFTLDVNRQAFPLQPISNPRPVPDQHPKRQIPADDRHRPHDFPEADGIIPSQQPVSGNIEHVIERIVFQ